MCNILKAYQFSLGYRPGKHNQVADALSRLPLPATEDDFDKCRLIEPGDVEVYFIGASGIYQTRLLSEKSASDISASDKSAVQVANIVPSPFNCPLVSLCQPTTDDVAERLWFTVQHTLPRVPEYSAMSHNDSSEIVDCVSVVRGVMSGQLEPGVVLYGSPIVVSNTVRAKLVTAADECRLAPINPPAPMHTASDVSDPPVTPAADADANGYSSVAADPLAAAHRFGDTLCQRRDVEWASAQQEDPLARASIRYVQHENDGSTEIFSLSELENNTFDIQQVKRIASQGALLELSTGAVLLVKRETTPTAHRPARVSGKFERLSGDENTRVYVPFLLRPWALDSVHKEGFHLGENVTLASAKRYYWWIGMSASVKWWIRHCIICQAAKNLPPSAALVVGFTPASIFARGDGIVRYFRASAKNTERQ